MKKKLFLITVVTMTLILCSCSKQNSSIEEVPKSSISNELQEPTTKIEPDTAKITTDFEDYIIVPEEMIFDQAVIAQNETVLWLGIDRETLLYAHQLLSGTTGQIVTFYFYDLVDDTDTFRFDLALHDVEELLVILEDNPGCGFRLGKNLPPDCIE